MRTNKGKKGGQVATAPGASNGDQGRQRGGGKPSEEGIWDADRPEATAWREHGGENQKGKGSRNRRAKTHRVLPIFHCMKTLREAEGGDRGPYQCPSQDHEKREGEKIIVGNP